MMSLGLSFGLIAAAFATNSNLEQANYQAEEALRPFQNQTTIAQLIFDTLEMDTERANEVALHALYRKTGPQNLFEVKVDNLSYHYDAGSPKTTFKGSLSTDFTKLIPQDQINSIIPMAAEMVEELVKDFAEEYEDAISVKGEVTSTTKDEDGNYTGLTALFSMKIDLNKLPGSTSSEEVMFTEAMVAVSLNIKTGLNLDAFLISNPQYKSFNQEQEGLKEALEKLLAGDEEAIDSINDLVMRIDDLASGVVNSLNLWSHFNVKK